MDFKNRENKTLFQGKIKELLTEYQSLFDSYTSTEKDYKKAALLYYWMRDYKNLLCAEDKFNPNFMPAFERGNVVNVNLGFNLGAEMGGLHYAVVLANSNKKNPNIVVAPLTSVKPGKDIKHLRPTEIAIGEELYSMIQGKYTALKTSIPAESKLLQLALNGYNDTFNIHDKLRELDDKVLLLAKTMKKLQVLKHGSIVVLNQIRTISKMRISDPTDKYDILYGLKLSSKHLDAIDDRLANLYLKNLDK